MYTSINNPKIKNLKKLQQKKYRDKENLFLVEGKHLVEEAYKVAVERDIKTVGKQLKEVYEEVLKM